MTEVTVPLIPLGVLDPPGNTVRDSCLRQV